MTDGTDATVLVVDDEPDVADLYEMHLQTAYQVRSARGGEEALSELDDTVDVVLLDRRMPGLSGDDVLEEIRARGLDCRVVMVTAITPDFDIIDMPFDDYLVKPISKDELLSTVERMLLRSDYQDLAQRYFTLTSKHAALSSHKTEAELTDSEQFQRLEAELEEVKGLLDSTAAQFEAADFDAMFKDFQ